MLALGHRSNRRGLALLHHLIQTVFIFHGLLMIES